LLVPAEVSEERNNRDGVDLPAVEREQRARENLGHVPGPKEEFRRARSLVRTFDPIGGVDLEDHRGGADERLDEMRRLVTRRSPDYGSCAEPALPTRGVLRCLA
jgi:hypothetical protein